MLVCLSLRVPLKLVCLPQGLGRPVESFGERHVAFSQRLAAVLRLSVLVRLCPGLAQLAETLGMLHAAFFPSVAAVLPSTC